MVRSGGTYGLRAILLAVWAVVALVLQSSGAKAEPAGRAPMLDCPLRDARLSLASPLIDVLLVPAGRRAIATYAPPLARGLNPFFARTQPPAFGAIVTIRDFAAFVGVDPSALGPLDAALARIGLTAADKAARCARYDDIRPSLPAPDGRPRVLLFEKINGFRDDPSVAAAHAAIEAMARRRGWQLVATDRAGVMRPDLLRGFAAVIWNNVSGDVLTLRQRAAFRRYIENGGGYTGIHGSGGDPAWFWNWYADRLLGARFIGHPLNPQFQQGRVVVDDPASSITRGLRASWMLTEEWYSFRRSPRATGAHVLLTLDEASYSPVGLRGQDLRMGDHPLAWTRCVGRGRSFYSALGHRPENYSDADTVLLMEQGIAWAMGNGPRDCLPAARGTRP